MGSVCAEHHHHLHPHHHQQQTHKFHSLRSPNKSLQDLNIPPRKLLSRRNDVSDYFGSPSADAAVALMQKFLPCNGETASPGGGIGGSDDVFDPDDDPYSSDEFRMYEFKVRKCTRSRSHDWTDCPFSHPGEKARRRDPRRFHYSGTVCPEYRRSGSCSRGDDCEFAHGVFECWLHPARYRTEACKDGKNCKRKVCFFAHSPRELRVLPVEEEDDERNNCSQGGNIGKHHSHNYHHQQQQQQHCCRYCCAALSPTSTLLGMSNLSPPMSPSLSPPMSPMKAVGARGLSRYSDRVVACGAKGLSYEDMVIADLLGSLEGMSITEAMSPNKGNRGLWVDVGSGGGGGCYDSASGEEHLHHQHQQMQFSLSPSTPINPSVFSSSRDYFNSSSSNSSVSSAVINNNNNNAGIGIIDESPDLGWVNELLM